MAIAAMEIVTATHDSGCGCAISWLSALATGMVGHSPATDTGWLCKTATAWHVHNCYNTAKIALLRETLVVLQHSVNAASGKGDDLWPVVIRSVAITWRLRGD